ncbi:unnamed protein product [Ambrosiozyma monospora]|uniref:Unnamed protein product n=1 Tax=Ambrosiozyma monospora TaxID=43982 RepID=A0ACB5SW87_AMBMO|nr:unnamed protein product [Ambrosiozyma monospora]
MLDEIFDQPDDGFNNLEFDNIDENDNFIEEDEEPLVKHTSVNPHTDYSFGLHDEPYPSHRTKKPVIFSDNSYFTDQNGEETSPYSKQHQLHHQPHQLHHFPLGKKSPRRICSPSTSKGRIPTKSNIRIRKNLLNLIVESSDGSLEDATRYATEINSQNCEGIPIPEKITELVTIPTTGQAPDGIKKAAIVRAMIARTANTVNNTTTPKKSALKSHMKHNSTGSLGKILGNNNGNINNSHLGTINGKAGGRIGFYSQDEQREFLKRDQKSNHFDEIEDKENKRLKSGKKDSVKIKTSPLSINHTRHASFGGLINSSKRVSWAPSLEW